MSCNCPSGHFEIPIVTLTFWSAASSVNRSAAIYRSTIRTPQSDESIIHLHPWLTTPRNNPVSVFSLPYHAFSSPSHEFQTVSNSTVKYCATVQTFNLLRRTHAPHTSLLQNAVPRTQTYPDICLPEEAPIRHVGESGSPSIPVWRYHTQRGRSMEVPRTIPHPRQS